MTTSPETDRLRADKWLFYARFFKTRALAAQMIRAGHLRVDGQRATKPAHALRPGQVLTFVQARRVRVVRITHLAQRRGPAPEARALYDDLTPDTPPAPPRAPGHDGPGRPNAKDRRNRRKFAPSALE